jgi:hypothetical protein
VPGENTNDPLTKWHVYRSFDKREIGPLKNDKAFQKYVSGQCDALRLRQQIANGSKHCRLTGGKSDLDVNAEISASVIQLSSMARMLFGKSRLSRCADLASRAYPTPECVS